MPARKHSPRGGSKARPDSPRGGAARALPTDVPDSGPVTLKPKVAPRSRPPTSHSFTAPIRESVRESFFDLAQRYQSLRESARKATRSKKPAAFASPAVSREPRLTDLPPPRPELSTISLLEEPPEEPTHVQPLAVRGSEPPPALPERRQTTVRPPPPPDPLPRMLMPSSFPPPVAMGTSAPPPPAPPPSVWRPMLAAAALSAAIGAFVSGGVVAWRGQSRPVAALTATASPGGTAEIPTSATGPCPVDLPAPSTQVSSSSALSRTGDGVLASSSVASTSQAVPMQVSVDNLPLESKGGRPVEVSTSGHAPVARAVTMRASASAADHVPTAAERRRARREAQAAARVAATQNAKSSDSDSDDDDEAPAALPPSPPPAPTKGPDRAAIAKAVARASSAATACDSGPRHGRASITFAPSGNVQAVSLVESFGDSAVNGCVLRALGRAHVPPFAGGPVDVRKALSW